MESRDGGEGGRERESDNVGGGWEGWGERVRGRE